MAEQVAVLLLARSPVCVLGADDVPVTERLRFIDTVMAMLPYGLRATMSAATWAGSTSQHLKLRLFFTGAPRAGAQPADGRPGTGDRLVQWAHPEAIHATGEAALLYQELAEGRAGTGPSTARRGRPARSASMLRTSAEWSATLPKDKGIPETLDDLGQSLLNGGQGRDQDAVKRLRRYLARGGTPADLTGYQRRVRADRLLADDDRLSPELKGELYGVLLPVAFGIPLTYVGYCAVEECAGVPLHTSLRTALAGRRPPTASPGFWPAISGQAPTARSGWTSSAPATGGRGRAA